MNTPDLLSVESHFAFGKNWLDYAAKIDEGRIAQAVADLQRLSGRERFDGLSFLDIGCGSGLHSLAALRMGAARVVGVDIDPDSVAASRATIGRFAADADATFRQVSVFDMTPEEYGGFDLVYSWGVLHHTGDMYRALTSAAALVSDGGQLMLALYRKTPSCGIWRRIKRWYSHAPRGRQMKALRIYLWIKHTYLGLWGVDVAGIVREYSKNRGMDYYNDVHDWLGGYPYESIRPERCRHFVAELGFVLCREFVQKPGRLDFGQFGSGCDEFVFRRQS